MRTTDDRPRRTDALHGEGQPVARPRQSSKPPGRYRPSLATTISVLAAVATVGAAVITAVAAIRAPDAGSGPPDPAPALAAPALAASTAASPAPQQPAQADVAPGGVAPSAVEPSASVPTAPPTDGTAGAGPGPAPEFDVVVSPAMARPGQAVRFSVVAADGSPLIASVQWLVDGVSGDSGLTMAHSFSQPGTYAVRARARAADGAAGTATARVTIDGTAPILTMRRAGPRFVRVNAVDGGVGVRRVEISFGDGAAYRLVRRSKTALPPGSYTVHLRAFDRAGNVATASAWVDVPAAP